MCFFKNKIYLLLPLAIILLIIPLLFKFNYIFFYKQLSIVYLISGAILQVISLLYCERRILIIPSCILLTVGLLLQVKFFITMHHIGIGLPLYALGLCLGIFQYYFQFSKNKFLLYIAAILFILSFSLLLVGCLKVIFYYFKLNALIPSLIAIFIVGIVFFFIYKNK